MLFVASRSLGMQAAPSRRTERNFYLRQTPEHSCFNFSLPSTFLFLPLFSCFDFSPLCVLAGTLLLAWTHTLDFSPLCAFKDAFALTHTLCNVIFYNVRLSKKIPWFVRKLEYSFDYIHVMLVTGAGVVQVIDNKDLFGQMEIVKAAQPKTV